MKTPKFIFCILSIAALISCTKEISDNTGNDFIQQTSSLRVNNKVDVSLLDKHGHGEIIIKFKANASPAGKANFLTKLKGKVKERIHTASMKGEGDNEGIVVISTALGITNAINDAKKFAEIEFAEPNYIYKHTGTPNDHYIANLWGMNTGFGTQATTTWEKGLTGSNNIVIGVLDQGIQVQHPDLKRNIWVNPNDPINGKDDDKNGYIDDVHGWDFYHNDNSVYDEKEDHHGTHVAGTIGAVGGNGIGVAGMNWNVTMISAKFLGPQGGSTSDAVKAIEYFINLKNAGINIVAINNSWGGGGYSLALYQAIERANKAGILFVASAGNNSNNNDAKEYYPASYTNANVISVAAIDQNGALWRFSNYGATSVHLGAPGIAIFSTLPGGYGYYSGTSMAAPHVTGAIALYAAHNTIKSKKDKDYALKLKQIILDAAKATPTHSLSGKTICGGRLNVSTF